MARCMNGGRAEHAHGRVVLQQAVTVINYETDEKQ